MQKAYAKKKLDIHNYDRRFEGSLKNLRKDTISEKNKQLIESFVNDLLLEGVSKPRMVKYFDSLRRVAKYIKKDLDKATKEDLKLFIGDIQRRRLSPWTKQAYKVIVRRFYKWMYKTEEYPEIVKWISIRISRCETRLPSDGELLTPAEIESLITAAVHPRDKALVSVLWESGARVSEIGNLRMQHVRFDKHGIVVVVTGKTGSRKVRLITSTPYLSTWLHSHPFRDDPQAPVWVNVGNTNRNKQMAYAAITKTLKRLFEKIGLKKKCNPHLFRHSRATFMASHLTEFQMNQYFGWIQGSKMPSTYVHLNGREVDRAILQLNGIAAEEKPGERQKKPVICPRCDTINTHDSKHCRKCGGVVDLKVAMELEERQKEISEKRSHSDELMTLLLKDKEVQALLMEKMKGFGTLP